MTRRSIVLVMAASLIAVAGCGRQARLNLERDFEIESMEFKQWEFDAPAKEQKVTVFVRTSGGALDVYVALANEFPALKDQLDKQVAVTAKTIARKEKVDEGQLEAVVPAGSKFVVVVSNPGNQSLKASLKVTGS